MPFPTGRLDWCVDHRYSEGWPMFWTIQIIYRYLPSCLTLLFDKLHCDCVVLHLRLLVWLFFLINKNTFVFVCVFVCLQLAWSCQDLNRRRCLSTRSPYTWMQTVSTTPWLPVSPALTSPSSPNLTTVETRMSAFFPRPSLTCFCAQTAEALEEKPKGAPAPPAPEINPRKKAALNPVPAPRRLPSASSTPCIPSSAGSADTRMRTQSDSRGQSKSSSPRQEVGAPRHRDVNTFFSPLAPTSSLPSLSYHGNAVWTETQAGAEGEDSRLTSAGESLKGARPAAGGGASGATVPAIEGDWNLLEVLTAPLGPSLAKEGTATRAQPVKLSRFFSCTICTLTTEGGGLWLHQCFCFHCV